MHKLILILFLGFVGISNAQDKRGNTTIYGGGGVFAKFSTNGSWPQTGQLFPTPASFASYVYIEGAHSCISDSTDGQLLFFTNSVIAYDTLGHIMDNGDSLQPKKIYEHNCCPSSGQGITQGSIILPKKNNLYYIIIPTLSDSAYDVFVGGQQTKVPYDILQYHIVDMNANGGLGKVVQKNIKLLENVELNKTGMMACKHANGYDWWLLKQGANTNTIYTFLVTKDSISLDTIQSFPQPIFGYYDLAGQSCFSNDGSKYAFASGGVNSGGAKLFIADFDRCYGILNNVKEIKQPLHNTNSYLDTIYPGEKDTLIRGLCFSPNDSFLYVSCGYNIYQYEYNVLDSNQAWYHVKHGMDTSFIQFAEYGQLQLAPDGRIYIGKRGGTTNSNSVINEPNLKGAACNFCRKCLRMDTTQWYTHSLANIPNFNMPPKTPCWPLNNEQLIMNNEQWALYPNPVNTILYIHNANGKKKKLYNTYGQLLISTTKEEIDISGLAKGLYFLNCEEQTQKVLVE